MINWCEIREITLISSAVIGVFIAIYRLVLKPRVCYSIETLTGPINQIVKTGVNGTEYEACDGRIIRIQNKSFLPLCARNIYIHVRAFSPFRRVLQSGIYTTRVSPTDNSNPSKDLTFFLESLPPGGKLKIEFECWKSERPQEKPFFADHSVLTADGKAKKVKKLKGFDYPSPME